MQRWGEETYGDPCRECGYRWSISEADALAVIATAPDRFAGRLAGRDGTGRSPDLDWDAREYVWHVADNLRIWAERLSALTPGGTLDVVPYDQDDLAGVRGYRNMPLVAALWSVGRSAAIWGALWPTVPPDGRLLHPESGAMDRRQVLVQVTHDTAHHLVDVERSH
jgi:hypothetical protein